MYPIGSGTDFALRKPYSATLRIGIMPYWQPTDAPPERNTEKQPHPPLAYWEYPTDPLLRPILPPAWYQPARRFPAMDRPSLNTDDGSAWARWHSSLWGVTTTLVTFLSGMVVAFTFLPTDVTGWKEAEFSGLKGNFTEGPRFDNDRFFFDYVAHPLGGSEYYIIARNRKLNWWQSLTYSAAVSATFEFFVESAYERASWQDLWITPVSGAVIGELRWQAKKSLENPSTGRPIGTWNKILYVVVDPFDAVYKL